MCKTLMFNSVCMDNIHTSIYTNMENVASCYGLNTH